MTYGTVTFMIEGDEETVYAAQERIQKVIETECPDLILSVTEDSWEEGGKG